MRKPATTRGAVPAVGVISIIVAGFGFWFLRGVAPTGSAARSTPTAAATATLTTTSTLTATSTLTPTSSPTATLVPTAKAAPPTTPRPVPAMPQLSVTPQNFIYESNCRGTFSPYAITVTNTGGGTLTWQIS